MATISTTTATQLFQDFPGKFQSRKLLQPTPPPPDSYTGDNTNPNLDSNVATVFSFLLCAIICSIGLNFLIKCALSACAGSASGNARTDQNSSTSRVAADKGIKQKALRTFPVVKYSPELRLPGQDTECVICLSEFAPGERVRLLPKCNHGFHVRCIDKWLKSHSSCPKCRNCLIETCQKIVGRSSQAATPSGPPSSMLLPAAVQEAVVSRSVVVPLEPEGMVVPDCRGLSQLS